MYHSSTEVLRDGWLIAHDGGDIGREQRWFETGLPEERTKETVLPSFGHMSFPDCYGIFWYQKRFVPAGKPSPDEIYELRIGAADFLCETYLNGKLVGVYRDTETPFSYDVTGFLEPDRENLLVFRVSKPHAEEVDGYRFGEVPHRNQLVQDITPGTCFNTTGIAGNVELAILPKLRITDLFVTGDPETSSVEAEITVHSDYPEPLSAELAVLAGNKRTGELCSEVRLPVRVEKGDRTVRVSVPIDDVRLWSLDDPFLYSVTAELGCGGTVRHRLRRHCGFRTFRVREDGYFELNGKRIFVRCSHTGNAFPYSTQGIPTSPYLIRQDLLMAKASGLNMLRFISGVALPDQLDYADEIGLMIYEEPMASWLTENGPHSREIYRFAVREMIRRDRSHPSVCIWGLLNETFNLSPGNECYRWAKEILPMIRESDPTRMVLLSSGRWDGDPSVGSLANPGQEEWQCLWGKEGRTDPASPYIPSNKNYYAYIEDVGDIHFYPKLPISADDLRLLRTMGCDVRRPVFLSENGCGSMFDVVWLARKFEQEGADRNMPDVRQILRMKELFFEALRKYGFEAEYAFPGDILRESQRLSARHRAFCFDIVRSNPYINGYSITGLLDHSICGEGLWTFLREWKPGVVDAMANGLAPLKWCIFPENFHLYSGRSFRLNIVLANEDVLKEKDYPVSVRILGEDGIVYSVSDVLHPDAESLKTFSVPVFDREVTLNVPTGRYEIHCDIEGAAATDSCVRIYVTDDRDIRASAESVVVWGLNPETEELLSRKGIRTVPLSEADETVPAAVLLGRGPEEEKETVFSKVYRMLETGSRVFVASGAALMGPDDGMYYFRAENKPVNVFAVDWPRDWLYHKEYLAKRRHPYFAGMPKGIMDWEYWGRVINGGLFRDGAAPDETVSASFGTGLAGRSLCECGFNIGKFRFGKGTMVLNSYSLLENIGKNPAADRLLINILNDL